jgi:putative transposase
VKRLAATHLKVHFGFSVSRACRLVALQRSTYHYKAAKTDNEADIVKRMQELIGKHKSWGYPIIHDILRREGLVKNPKRTWRIYKENNLTLKLRKRHKRASMLRLELTEPTKPNERWAMDFMSDGLWNGRKFKVLTILDIFTKECLAIEIDTSINGNRVTRVLDWFALTRGVPEVITTDNGPEFAGIALDRWAYNNNVRLDFIKPGKPIQNAFIESFNGRLRHECLNQHYFVTLEEAKKIIEAWRLEYNTFRPHGSLKGLTPEEFRKIWQDKNQQKAPEIQLTSCTA